MPTTISELRGSVSQCSPRANPTSCLLHPTSQSEEFVPRTPERPGTMTFRRFVEVGRVCMINYGPLYGKLVVIVDIVDQNRALIDAADIVRQQCNFKRLALTDLVVDIPKCPKKSVLKEALEAADVEAKWKASSWGRKLIVQKRREELSDFDRYKVMVARIKKSEALRKAQEA